MPESYIDAKAAVVREKGGQFLIEPVRLRRPQADEVLVRIAGTGLCHADLMSRDEQLPTPFPVVLGHEGSGIVEQVGPEVRNLRPGDRVVLSYGLCGRCDYCASGFPGYCDKMLQLNWACDDGGEAAAIQDAGGNTLRSHYFAQSSFATHALSREINIVKVPEDVPLELLGPLGCGIQTGAGAVINTLKVRPGGKFVVFGAGAVGLSAVMAARLSGAAVIIAVDVVASRMELAKELGATHTINGRDGDVVAQIKALTGGGAEYILEASGHTPMIMVGIDALARRGTLAIAGGSLPGARADFDPTDLLLGGKSIRGLVEGDSVPQMFIPELIALYQQGRFPFDRLVKFYELDQINQAAEDSVSGKTIKAILRMA